MEAMRTSAAARMLLMRGAAAVVPLAPSTTSSCLTCDVPLLLARGGGGLVSPPLRAAAGAESRSASSSGARGVSALRPSCGTSSWSILVSVGQSRVKKGAYAEAVETGSPIHTCVSCVHAPSGASADSAPEKALSRTYSSGRAGGEGGVVSLYFPCDTRTTKRRACPEARKRSVCEHVGGQRDDLEARHEAEE